MILGWLSFSLARARASSSPRLATLRWFNGEPTRDAKTKSLDRAINSMIEFKQIIGRGTRLYDGKSYFTVYDFVKAHHHFSDPEWDGEPLDPEPREPRSGAPDPGPEAPEPGPEPDPRPQKAKVKLADGKDRMIQHMMSTTFWHSDGTPMSAQQFMGLLFGRLPEFFKDEAELREIWSDPGHGGSSWTASRRKDSEAISLPRCNGSSMPRRATSSMSLPTSPMPCLHSRAKTRRAAKIVISTQFSDKQQAFLDFVLAHYVRVGVAELDETKLTPLLRLKYHNSIADAVADLGQRCRHPQGLYRLPEVPVRARSRSVILAKTYCGDLIGSTRNG